MTENGAGLDLRAFLASERREVEQALVRALDSLGPRIPEAFRPAVAHGVTSGGKRLRPILCVTAYRAAGGGHRSIYDLAVSLELIHAYSLIHDDLPCMDDAALRRGEPTTHAVHGERKAMVAGGLLIPAAALQIWEAAGVMGLSEETSRQMILELSCAAGAGGMVGGQVLDLLGETRELSELDLNDLHSRKTGALLKASLRMGALAAEAEPEEVLALENYGKSIGLAFQVADDILDATSDAETLGKNPSDADLGKSTYVTIFGLAEATKKARDLVDEAVQHLRDGGIDAPALEALARYVVDRRK